MKKVRDFFVSNRSKMGAVAASALVGGVASAQTAGDGTQTATINYPNMINAVQGGMITTINNSGPALFGFIAVIGGFYFVWGRIRSLW